MYVPPTHTNMVNPPFSSGQPLGVQPALNQPSWGYGYPENQLPVVNMNYQPTSTGNMYYGIPYLGNTFTPWGKPNWSYMAAMGGMPILTTGGARGPPYGSQPFGCPPTRVPPGRGPPIGGPPL